MHAYVTAAGMALGMKADMPERAREEFGRKIDDYDRVLHREISVHLAEIAKSEGG
jgi:hypothetical protein